MAKISSKEKGSKPENYYAIKVTLFAIINKNEVSDYGDTPEHILENWQQGRTNAWKTPVYDIELFDKNYSFEIELEELEDYQEKAQKLVEDTVH